MAEKGAYYYLSKDVLTEPKILPLKNYHGSIANNIVVLPINASALYQ